MIRIMTVVLALLAGSVFAGDPQFGEGALKDAGFEQIMPGTYKRGKQIIVTNNIPAEKLPAFIKDMTAKEFKSWAEKHNEQQYAAAARRHNDYLLARGPLTTMSLASSEAGHTTRFGGGAGAGGYGGAGGYLGYGNNSSSNFGGIGYGAFGGASFNGNNISTTDSTGSQSWVKTFPDMNDGGGGPIILINPYCFDYWRTRTESSQ